MIEKINEKIPAFIMNPQFRIYRHLILQFIILLISVNVLWDNPDELIITNDRLAVWIGYLLVIECIIYINIYFLTPRLLMKDKLWRYILAVLGMVLLAVAAVILMQSYLFDPGDLDEINEATSQPGINIWNLIFGMVSTMLAMSLLVFGTSAFLLIKYWINYNQRVDDLNTITLQSELKMLKDQINPHFLFNMLNNANVLIRKKRPEASEVLFKLEDLLRYQINDSSREYVQLSSEVHFLNDFLNLEKIRRDKFDFTISKEGNINSVLLPPMLFIPFVENAVKHNSDSENLAYVHLSFRVKNNELEFYCKNSKPAVQSRKDKVGGLGLKNIRRRLELLFPEKYRLEILDNECDYIVNLKLEL